MAKKDDIVKAAHDSFVRQAMDQGKLIEAGWRAFRIVAVPRDASNHQLDLLRQGYYHGAQHLFASIMRGLDSEADPTDADMRRMSLINDELAAFEKQEQLRYSKPGSASVS